MTAFLQSVKEARLQCYYPKELIGNTDETPMWLATRLWIEEGRRPSQLGQLEQQWRI